MTELICSTNLSFGMYPGLTHGACNALEMHGTEAQKRTFLPNMIHGRWSGTMCLTEPNCGTDLGLLRTRAEPLGAEPARVGPNGDELGSASCRERGWQAG